MDNENNTIYPHTFDAQGKPALFSAFPLTEGATDADAERLIKIGKGALALCTSGERARSYRGSDNNVTICRYRRELLADDGTIVGAYTERTEHDG